MTERTYFGLEIVGGRGVRPADIASLPFADFWSESSIRSAQTKDAATGEWLVRLSDWEEFSKLFIETGRHRNMPLPPQVLWFDREDDEPERTYFGITVVDQKYVRRKDIGELPFYEFWLARNGDKKRTVVDLLVDLKGWRNFSRRFIDMGQNYSP
ncbi:MAG: hypothetical protein AAGF32_02505 [Pseudomonadota bacterium]